MGDVGVPDGNRVIAVDVGAPDEDPTATHWPDKGESAPGEGAVGADALHEGPTEAVQEDDCCAWCNMWFHSPWGKPVWYDCRNRCLRCKR